MSEHNTPDLPAKDVVDWFNAEAAEVDRLKERYRRFQDTTVAAVRGANKGLLHEIYGREQVLTSFAAFAVAATGGIDEIEDWTSKQRSTDET